LAAAVGTVVYAVLLVWYRSYYGWYGVDTAAVGLRQVEVLAQAAVAAVLLLGVTFGVAGAGLLFGPSQPTQPIWTWSVPRAVIAVSVFAALPLLAFGFGLLAVLPLVFGARWGTGYWWRKRRHRPLRELSDTARAALIVGYIAALTGVCGLFALGADGSRAAVRAATGEDPGALAGMLGVRQVRVEVATAAGSVPAWAEGRRLFLVGRSDVLVVLIDRATGRTFAVPSTDLVLSIRVRLS